MFNVAIFSSVSSIGALTFSNVFDVIRLSSIREDIEKKKEKKVMLHQSKLSKLENSIKKTITLFKQKGIKKLLWTGYQSGLKAQILRNGTYFPLFEYFRQEGKRRIGRRRENEVKITMISCILSKFC